jgi:hypothetical protein
MGLITNLLRANSEKKLRDTDSQLQGYKTLLSLPEEMAPPETKQWALDNIMALTTGGSTGGKSGKGGKDGGHDILRSILGTMAGLNPMPGAPKSVGQRPQQLMYSGAQQEQKRSEIAQRERSQKVADLEAQLPVKAKEEAARGQAAADAYKANTPGVVAREQALSPIRIKEKEAGARPLSVAEQHREDVLDAYAAAKGKERAQLTPDERVAAIKEDQKKQQSETLVPEVKTYKTYFKVVDGLSDEEAEKKALAKWDKREETKQKGAETRVVLENFNALDKRDQQKSIPDIAEGIKNGSIPPDSAGLTRSGTWAKVVAQLVKDKYNLKEAELDWQGMKQHVRTLNGAQQTRLRQATEFATESLNLIDNPDKPGDDLLGTLRENVPRTQFPIINKAAIKAAKSGIFGQDAAGAATNLDTQIADLQSELAVVYKGGNSPTDVGIAQAKNILNSDWSEKTMRDAIGLARKNLTIRINSIKNTPGIGASGETLSPSGSAPTGASKADPLGILK